MIATASFILAVEEGEGGGGLGTVIPALPELVWGTVAFVLLMIVMFKFAFPNLNKMLEERQAQIQGQMREAERTREEAGQLRAQYQSQLADARNQANDIVEDARTQAERLRADILARAEEEAQQIVARAREDVHAERGRLVQDLRGQVAALSVELASKIVQKELDPAQHRALVDQYINELSGLS